MAVRKMKSRPMKIAEWRQLIKSSEPADRAEAADTLPEGGSDLEIALLLLGCVDDDDSLVRACALDTLHLLKGAAVAPKIRQRLEKEQDSLARTYAARTLALLGRPEDLEFLTSILQNDKSAIVRTGVAHGLLSSFLSVAVSTIVANCDSEDEKTRMASFAALTQLVDEMFSAFAKIRQVVAAHQNADEPRPTRDDIAKLLEVLPKSY
jgi:HEAT repeat protein